jgi:hypothetical protein
VVEITKNKTTQQLATSIAQSGSTVDYAQEGEIDYVPRLAKRMKRRTTGAIGSRANQRSCCRARIYDLPDRYYKRDRYRCLATDSLID